MDERGLDFSLRALGDRLGVSSMAPYRHFSDKSAIIDALADEILDRVRVEDPESVDAADELILGYAVRARLALLEHPALVPVVAARPLATETRAQDLALLHATFRRAGFPEAGIPEAVLTMVSITLGLVLYEQQRWAYDRSRGPSYQDDREALIADIVSDPDAAPSGEQIVRGIDSDAWATTIFENAIRDCYEGMKRRAGLAESSS